MKIDTIKNLSTNFIRCNHTKSITTPAFCGIFNKDNDEDFKNKDDRQIPGFENLGIYRNLVKKSKTNEKPPILDDDIFLIKMDTYKKNHRWAKKMNELTYKISDMISNDAKFSDILSKTEDEVREIRGKKPWGKRREESDYYELGPHGRGNEYWPLYLNLFDFDSNEPKSFIKPSPNDEYKGANTCLITYCDYPRAMVQIEYGWNGEKTNLKLVKKEYKKLKTNKNPTLDDINRTAATIHWLIAQETPYKRGSDSIANVLTKSIYHAYGVEISPVKEGKSFDFEAFYRDLDDYIKIYPTLFEKAPKFMEKDTYLSI